MIIWLNGTFGCGKTSTAAELHSLVRSSRVFDPETVGYMLQPNLADQPVSDFQHWPPWRPLVVATAAELARFTGQHLIAPQTILVRAYLEQNRHAIGLATSGNSGRSRQARAMHKYAAWPPACPAVVGVADGSESS